mmetsp:Transcript_16263/g.38244  ORF Transcript_16263/g.38244 Transcript_16263/m.38244 type:complete len:893 (+) Transcript_16263:50-2728(+)
MDKVTARVKCVVRVRPPSDGKNEAGLVEYGASHRGILTVHDPDGKEQTKEFLLDHVYPAIASQLDVYEEVCAPVVDHFVAGNNACIFGFGQLRSGKNFTMVGERGVDLKGMVPRVLDAIFKVADHRLSQNRKFKVFLSVHENYCDMLRDLGNSFGGSLPNLDVRDTDGKTTIEGLRIAPVVSTSESMAIISSGLAARQKVHPDENIALSTVIISIVVNQSDPITGAITSTLQLVDLAAPPCYLKLAEGQKLKEFNIVRKSLTALSTAISALNRDSDELVPFRDSKLTRVLQESLVSGSCVAMIAHIDPTSAAYADNMSVLTIANRARNSRGSAMPTKLADADPSEQDKIIKKLVAEIASLRDQLAAAHEYYQKKLENARDGMSTRGTLGGGAPLSPAPPDSRGTDSGSRPASLTPMHDDDEEATSPHASGNKADTLVQPAAQQQKAPLPAIQHGAPEGMNEVGISTFLTKQYGGEIRDLKEKLSKRGLELRELRESFAASEVQLRTELDNQRKKAQATHNDLREYRDQTEDRIAQQAERYQKEIEILKEHNQKLLEEMNKTMDALPQNFKRTSEQMRTIQSNKHDERVKQEAEFQDIIKRMEASQEAALQQQHEQYEYWLDKKVQELRSFVKQYNAYKQAKQEELETLEAQVISVFDYAQALAHIIENYETGLYAVYEKSGIKVVQVNPAHRPVPLSEDLCRVIGKYKQRAADFAEINRLAAENSSNSVSLSSTGNLAPRLPAAAQAPPPVDDTDVHRMSDLELRQAVTSLRAQIAAMQEQPQAERLRLEEEILNDLADHPTVEYIKQLEDERAYYKEQLAEEVKANRNAKISLDSKERQIQKLQAKSPGSPGASGRNTAMSNRSGHSTGPNSRSNSRPVSVVQQQQHVVHG